MKDSGCPFCEIAISDISCRIIIQNSHALAIKDAFPVNNGHALVIPKRHVASFFDVTLDERQALLDLLEQVKKELDTECGATSYNIGINDGVDAGQTIPHLHIHLIPRYKGDIDDPRGGIRWIFPEKAKYWD